MYGPCKGICPKIWLSWWCSWGPMESLLCLPYYIGSLFAVLIIKCPLWLNQSPLACDGVHLTWLDFLRKRLLHGFDQKWYPRKVEYLTDLCSEKIKSLDAKGHLFFNESTTKKDQVLQQWNSRAHTVAHASGCRWLCWHAHQGETHMPLDDGFKNLGPPPRTSSIKHAW